MLTSLKILLFSFFQCGKINCQDGGGIVCMNYFRFCMLLLRVVVCFCVLLHVFVKCCCMFLLSVVACFCVLLLQIVVACFCCMLLLHVVACCWLMTNHFGIVLKVCKTKLFHNFKLF